MSYKSFWCLLFLACLAGCQAYWPDPPPPNWLYSRPSGFMPTVKTDRIELQKDLFLLLSPQDRWARSMLEKNPFIKLTPAQAQLLIGADYSCPPGFTPYLIRSVSNNINNYSYSLSHDQHSLLIQHGTLGRPNYYKVPLVVNLDFELVKLFIETSAAN